MAATTTVDEAARQALASACERVEDATAADEVDGVSPGLVARPGSTAQVAEVMRAAAGHGLTVVARGRGTKTTWGLPPARADLVVDLSGMDQVLDHAAGDLIVEAQAGTRLSDVQQAVAGARQRLAIDETVSGASVGGTLAAGTSGPAGWPPAPCATCSSGSPWSAPTAWWPRPAAGWSRTWPATTSASSCTAPSAPSPWSPRRCSGCTRCPRPAASSPSRSRTPRTRTG